MGSTRQSWMDASGLWLIIIIIIIIGVLLGVLGGAAAPQAVGEVGNF